LNAAYRIGGESQLENVVQNDVFTVTAASAVQLTPSGDWFLVPEVNADIPVGADGIEDVNSPVEGLLAVRFLGVDHLVAELGGGMGLVPGVGSADYRLFLSIGGRSMPAPVVEEVVIIDPCADTPEDMDGFEDEDGCLDPDNDQDGVLDVNDGADAACANDPEDMDGFEDEDGCPDPDNDQDGVLDVDDTCPLEPEDMDGFEDEDGCPDPDNDQDGVLDVDDTCPLEPEDMDGNADTDGCPEDDRIVVTCEQLEISESVRFETNSDVIDSRSFDLLNAVAEVMNRASYIRRVRVEGHTDNVGPDGYNLDLSQRRAASVLRYLTERGVTAERIASEGFGETQPIDTNDTADGRSSNRRVVFVIVEQDACEE
jgi:outer membrane protein OmpA-like peptidoglycan-associated protein